MEIVQNYVIFHHMINFLFWNIFFVTAMQLHNTEYSCDYKGTTRAPPVA